MVVSLIILAVGFIVSMIVIWYLFSKLTPDNAPENLAGYFGLVLKVAVSVIISVYAALFLAQILLG